MSERGSLLRRALTGALLLMPLLLAIGAPPATAQGGDTPIDLSLDQAIDRALEQNAHLRAARLEAESAGLSARAERRSRWGSLDATASFSRLNDDQIIRPMSRELTATGELPFDRNQLHYGLEAEVPLYLGGRLRARIRVAEISSRIAEAAFRTTRWQTRFNVISTYSSAIASRAAGAALEKEIQALQQTRDHLALLVSTGRRPRVDLLKIDDQLQQALASHARVAAEQAGLEALLRSLVGLSPDQEVHLEELSEPAVSSVPSIDELQRRVLASSLMRRAELRRRAADGNTRIARAAMLPQVVSQGEYTAYDAPSLSDHLETWRASLVLRLPIFAAGSRAARMKAANRAERAAEAEAAQMRLDLLARVQQGLARMNAAKLAILAARTQRSAAEEAARIEQLRYDTGAGTIEDLLRARARQAEANSAADRARADLRIALAQIETLTESEMGP